MSSVKIYKRVNKNDKKLSFSISKMEDIYLNRKGKIDEPHRHNYYTILLINKAKGIHKIDFNNYELGEKQIYFVSPGQVHQVIEKEKSIGFVMTFSTDFLIQNTIPLSFIADLNLFQNYGQSPPLQPNEKVFNKITHYSNDIFELFHSQQNNKFLSIGAYLKLLLIQCSNICIVHSNKSVNEKNKSNIIRNFKSAVDQHYKKEHSTSFYANLLNITSDHLNRSV